MNNGIDTITTTFDLKAIAKPIAKANITANIRAPAKYHPLLPISCKRRTQTATSGMKVTKPNNNATTDTIIATFPSNSPIYLHKSCIVLLHATKIIYSARRALPLKSK